MTRRTFIQSTSAAAGSLALAPVADFGSTDIQPAHEQLQNWAGNLSFSTQTVYYPKTIDDVQQAIQQCKEGRALGSRHSFNTIADSMHNLISLRDMNKVVSLDKEAKTVTVEAGITYGQLAPYLYQNGYALHNLASLPHISVGGACATATHGSGVHNGNLSTAVSAIEFVTAKGDVITLSRSKDGEAFNGAVVSLGALGVVTKMTLDLLPSFDMKQVVYRNLPMAELKEHFYEIMSSGYSVSLFTDWSNKNVNEVWIKRKADDNKEMPDVWHGAKKATQNMHPIDTESAENTTEQMDKPGPWYERMPHFKMGFKPSAGKELQAEFFVPVENAYDAMTKIETIHEEITPHLFISEIRTIKKDNLWMSPCYNKDCVAIHTTWKQETEIVPKLVAKYEELLAPYSPHPHWAKLFSMPPSVLQPRLEKLSDFKQLVAQYDPEGKFRNEFLKKNLYS